MRKKKLKKEKNNSFVHFVNESFDYCTKLIYSFILNSLLFTFIPQTTVDMAVTNKINVNTIWVMIDWLL